MNVSPVAVALMAGFGQLIVDGGLSRSPTRSSKFVQLGPYNSLEDKLLHCQ